MRTVQPGLYLQNGLSIASSQPFIFFYTYLLASYEEDFALNKLTYETSGYKKYTVLNHRIKGSFKPGVQSSQIVWGYSFQLINVSWLK